MLLGPGSHIFICVVVFPGFHAHNSREQVATLEAMVYNGAAGGAAAAPGGVTTPSVNPALALGSSWHGSPPKRKGSTTSISSKDSMGLGMSAVDPPEAPIYGTCFGYVYKLSSGRGIGGKQWQKRWFVVRDNGMIHYFKSARESTDNMSGTRERNKNRRNNDDDGAKC